MSQFKRRRSILILVAVFFQHNINSVMNRKEEASDSLNNKLEKKSRTEFVNNCESVLNNFELCYRGTSFKVQGGFGNCGIFLAHNYLSEQFGNYVEYGMCIWMYFAYTHVICISACVYVCTFHKHA